MRGWEGRLLRFHSLQVSSYSKIPALEMSDTLTALPFFLCAFVWIFLTEAHSPLLLLFFSPPSSPSPAVRKFDVQPFFSGAIDKQACH